MNFLAAFFKDMGFIQLSKWEHFQTDKSRSFFIDMKGLEGTTLWIRDTDSIVSFEYSGTGGYNCMTTHSAEA